MESILSNESFSYSWLINIQPSSFDALNDSLRFSLDTIDGSSFIEMDPNFISMRWTSSACDFDFILPSSESPDLVHADEIFSDGLLLPLHLVTPSEEVSGCSESMFSRALSPDSSKSLLSRSNRHNSRYFHAMPSRSDASNSSPLFHPMQSSTKSVPAKRTKAKMFFFKSSAAKPKKKILCKYLCFLILLCKKVKRLRLVSRNQVQSCTESRDTSPRMSNALLSIDRCRGNAMLDMGSEKSIHEAVLYCKKSYVNPV